jgi:hypothetical protein
MIAPFTALTVHAIALHGVCVPAFERSAGDRNNVQYTYLLYYVCAEKSIKKPPFMAASEIT